MLVSGARRREDSCTNAVYSAWGRRRRQVLPSSSVEAVEQRTGKAQENRTGYPESGDVHSDAKSLL